MIYAGDRMSGNPVLLDASGSGSRLKRLRFTDRTIEEGWIQGLIEKHPEVLPVAEIEPVFSPLLSVGREVSTGAGSIDNLFLSPEGYLTIVETKLWRNPEARRQVVGQIIDYAKDVSGWSFEDLDSRVREYNRDFRTSGLGIVDTIRLTDEMEEPDESLVVDAVARNLERGRFLLLVVGDGIRESVEAMASFLQSAPQLHFTLALIELQVYEAGGEPGRSLLVVPQVVARTREITRAVVRLEGKAREAVSVDMDTEVETTRRPRTRSTLSQQDYFDALGRHVDQQLVDFVRRIMEDVEGRGCMIQWRKAAFSVRLRDPGGSGRKLTLFVVTTDGGVYPGWLAGQLQSLGLSEEISLDFVKDSARLFTNCEPNPKVPDTWSRYVSLPELYDRYDEFLDLVETAIDRIRKASEDSEQG